MKQKITIALVVAFLLFNINATTTKNYSAKQDLSNFNDGS